MDSAEFRDLVAGMDSGYLCQYLNIHPRTLNRWKNGTAAVPQMAVRLLKLKLEGDVAAVCGDDWQGFRFGHDGKLYAPYHRRGFTPLQIAGMFFEVQELRHLRLEVKKLAAALATEQANTWAMQQVRRLAKLESDADFTRRG